MKENAACPARSPLEDSATVHRSRLKIATDMVGIIGSPMPRQPRSFGVRKPHLFALISRGGYQQRSAWTLSGRERNWANGKIPHHGRWHIWHHTARNVRQDPPMSGIRRAFSISDSNLDLLNGFGICQGNDHFSHSGGPAFSALSFLPNTNSLDPHQSSRLKHYDRFGVASVRAFTSETRAKDWV